MANDTQQHECLEARGVLFKDESMGQIRKRGAFYQIRYYRSGQRIRGKKR